MITKIYKKRKQIVWLFLFPLFPLFLAWANIAFAMPLLSIAMGSSHNLFLAYEHGEIHLSLGHHENDNNRGLSASDLHEHEHACSYNDYAVSSSGQNSHVDHEFHISSLVQQNIATVKTHTILELSTPLATINRSMPKYFDPASIKSSLQSFSETKSTLFSLRKVVLLI